MFLAALAFGGLFAYMVVAADASPAPTGLLASPVVVLAPFFVTFALVVGLSCVMIAAELNKIPPQFVPPFTRASRRAYAQLATALKGLLEPEVRKIVSEYVRSSPDSVFVRSSEVSPNGSSRASRFRRGRWSVYIERWTRCVAPAWVSPGRAAWARVP